MKSRAPIIAFYVVIFLLVLLSIAVAYKLVFVPSCTPTKDIPCPATDVGSIAGIAATVMGVAATVLALLGAFAVAAWWNQLDERVNEQVTKQVTKQVDDIFRVALTPRVIEQVTKQVDDIFRDVLTPRVDKKVKDLENTLTEADNNLTNNLQIYSQVQEATIKNMNDVTKALLHLSVGIRLWEQMKIRAAIEEFLVAKQLQPKDAQLNYILGEVYRKISLYDKAIDCLEIAIFSEKEFALAHFELGMAYRSQADKLYTDLSQKQQHDKEYEKAIEHLNKATRLLPDDEEIIATLGGTYRRYGNYQAALNCYHRALNLNPVSSYALGNLVLLSWHEGKPDDSRVACNRTHEIATNRIHSNISYEPFWDYYDLAMANLILGQKEEALNDYRSAAKLTFNPENFNSVLNGLYFLKEVEDKYPIDGLNDALAIVESAKTEAENRIAKQITA